VDYLSVLVLALIDPKAYENLARKTQEIPWRIRKIVNEMVKCNKAFNMQRFRLLCKNQNFKLIASQLNWAELDAAIKEVV